VSIFDAFIKGQSERRAVEDKLRADGAHLAACLSGELETMDSPDTRDGVRWRSACTVLCRPLELRVTFYVDVERKDGFTRVFVMGDEVNGLSTDPEEELPTLTGRFMQQLYKLRFDERPKGGWNILVPPLSIFVADTSVGTFDPPGVTG
jgi:hypothetical protein